MFVENGHDRNYLYFIVRKKNIKHLKLKTDSNIVKLPWIPIIGPKIRKYFEIQDVRSSLHQLQN